MILTYSVLLGCLAGVSRATYKQRTLQLPNFQHTWLILLGFVPQLFVFHLTSTRDDFPTELVPSILIATQVICLLFVWFNSKQMGIVLFGIGLGLNLIVIIFNGGWMPISPQTVQTLWPDATSWQIGERLWYSKDMVLAVADTNFWLLSDRFLLSMGNFYKVAFSLGDIFIAGGIFQTLWAIGSESSK